MGITSRKKRPLDRGKVDYRDANIFVIATEGSVTEKQYFDIFHNSRIQILVLPAEEHKSAPEYVLKRLRGYKKDYQLGSGDELWLIVDVDSWKDKKLAAVAKECKTCKFEMGVSNPCFELWLYLHFRDIDSNHALGSKEMKKYFNAIVNENNGIMEYSQKSIKEAIHRAKELDEPNQLWPQQLGTHVYKVVEKIIS